VSYARSLPRPDGEAPRDRVMRPVGLFVTDDSSAAV